MKRIFSVISMMVLSLCCCVGADAATVSATFEKDIVPTVPIVVGGAVIIIAVIILVVYLARKNRN